MVYLNHAFKEKYLIDDVSMFYNKVVGDYEHFDKNFPGGMVLWYVDKSIKKRCLAKKD